jgi:hypothetical protein
MDSFIKWMFAVALSLAATGQLKSATLKMAQLAIEAQKHQISYGKFSRMLTEPHHKSMKSGAKF